MTQSNAAQFKDASHQAGMACILNALTEFNIDSLQSLKDKFNADPVGVEQQFNDFALSTMTFPKSPLSAPRATPYVDNLSIKARNEIAFASMRLKSFERIMEAFTMLDGKTVCEILGITKQALSKKCKSAKVLSYTYKTRKYYPDFQFKDNVVNPLLLDLMARIEESDLTNTAEMNVFLSFLNAKVQVQVDADTTRKVKRLDLLEKESDRIIMARDYPTRYEMGQ